jgi:ankyrin repeat protein
MSTTQTEADQANEQDDEQVLADSTADEPSAPQTLLDQSEHDDHELSYTSAEPESVAQVPPPMTSSPEVDEPTIAQDDDTPARQNNDDQEQRVPNASLNVTISRAFSKYDKDNSNTIDASELEQLCAELGLPLANEVAVRDALSSLDADESGTIDKEEFVKWWTGQNDNAEHDTLLSQLREQGLRENHIDIHTASWKGDLQTIKRLLALDRALVNAPDVTEFGNDNRPIHYACYQGHIGCVEHFLQHGANVNVRNLEGCTPLFLGAQQGQLEVVRLLLRAGNARLDISDKQHGLCPLDVAKTDECRRLLEASYDLSAPSTLSEPPMLARDKIGVITVSWNYVPEPVGKLVRLPIKLFNVQILDKADLGHVVAERTCRGEATSVTVAGVRSAKALVARVSASNSRGCSNWSSVSDSVYAVEVPEAPTKPQLTIVGRTSLRVDWAPVIDNGSTIQYIEVQLANVPEPDEVSSQVRLSTSEPSTLEWKSVGRFPVSNKNATLSGLEAATQVCARLTATNARGTSRHSPVSGVVKTRGMPVKTKRAVKKVKAVMAFQMAGRRKGRAGGDDTVFGSAA